MDFIPTLVGFGTSYGLLYWLGLMLECNIKAQFLYYWTHVPRWFFFVFGFIAIRLFISVSISVERMGDGWLRNPKLVRFGTCYGWVYIVVGPLHQQT